MLHLVFLQQAMGNELHYFITDYKREEEEEAEVMNDALINGFTSVEMLQ